MNEYQKILTSTLSGSLIVAVAVSCGFLIEGDVKGFALFFLLSSGVGFILYGLLGSTVWWLVYKYIFKMNPQFKSHKWSAVVAVLILSIVFISSALLGYSRVAEVVSGIVISIIGASASVFSFWLLFHRCNKRA